MSTTEPSEQGSETVTVDKRDKRAAEELIVPVAKGEGMFDVYSEDGDRKTVDIISPACTCPDFEYREPEGGCKHIRRVMFEIGERPIPDGVDPDPLMLKRREENSREQ